MKVNVVNKSNNKLPAYETNGSAGFDIRVDFSKITPENPIKTFGNVGILWPNKVDGNIIIRISPMSRALLPTGLFVAIPEGWLISFRPRSGLSIKSGLSLVNTPSTIDSKIKNNVFYLEIVQK